MDVPPNNEDMLTLQLILALDPMTLENGATAIFPGEKHDLFFKEKDFACDSPKKL